MPFVSPPSLPLEDLGLIEALKAECERSAVPLSHRAGGTAQRCTPRWSRPSRDFLAVPGRGLELAVKDDGAVTIARLSLTGRAPRRRASLVEEDSTQRVVD
jgi:hypothetical protein